MSKQLLAVEQFHGRSERAVNQEVSARCSLIGDDPAVRQPQRGGGGPPGRARPARHAGNHFKHGVRTVARYLEGLFLQHAVLAGQDCPADLGWDCRLSPESAPGPLLPATFPQAHRQIEDPQGPASRNLGLKRAKPGSKRRNPPLPL